MVIATPMLHLAHCNATFRKDISAAAQDCGFKKGFGAFTGETSTAMLADSGIKWTLTGHSERRVGFGYPVSVLNEVSLAVHQSHPLSAW